MDFNRLQTQITSRSSSGDERGLPPVESWNPPFCGDIDIRITATGEWLYQETPITRASLVKLFSSVLKKEHNHYFLVTPVEKVGIRVDDVPFVVNQWHKDSNSIVLTTQTGDVVSVGEDHPCELRTPPDQQDTVQVPYVKIRRNLWARLHQNVYYQLLNEATEIPQPRGRAFVVQSSDYTMKLGEMDE